MSFILDALKKSENARQREAGPALFEVKVAPQRRGLPLWAIIIGILLLINVAVVSWLLLRGHGAPPATAPHAASRAAPTPNPRAQAAAPAPAPASSGISQAMPATRSSTALRPMDRASPAPAPAVVNPSDFMPAVQPPPAGGTGGTQAAGSLPLYAEIAAGKHLPPLHLDLHVYDASPSKRFVMINMHKLHQGSSLPDGVTVVKIRPDGAVLSYHGREFLLPR